VSTIAHTDHPLSAPVSDDNAARLLRRAGCGAGARILDVGCAEAAWLITALELYPRATALGVDISAGSLDRARQAAVRRGVGDRRASTARDGCAGTGERSGSPACCSSRPARQPEPSADTVLPLRT
jgi:SAM-dependent methyltransferase